MFEYTFIQYQYRLLLLLLSSTSPHTQGFTVKWASILTKISLRESPPWFKILSSIQEIILLLIRGLILIDYSILSVILLLLCESPLNVVPRKYLCVISQVCKFLQFMDLQLLIKGSCNSNVIAVTILVVVLKTPCWVIILLCNSSIWS